MKFPKKVFFINLGCPKNLVELELMAGSLLTAGCILVDNDRDADIAVLNTCCFLPEARTETFNGIKSFITWKRCRRGRKIVVAGCLVEWDVDGSIRSKYPEVDYWAGGNAGRSLAEILQGVLPDGRTGCASSFIYDENTPRLQMTLPHVAYLKISDGCDNRCSYCAIPGIRGKLVSRTVDSVVAEAQMLVNNGVRELVLIAQDTTAFGMDRNGKTGDFALLLRKLEELKTAQEFKIRLLYTHPAHYNDELIHVIASSGRVLPYLDIPLQHIDDNILARMGRKVTSGQVTELLDKLRSSIPDLTLRTTFITGFPGEGEEEYGKLRDFILRQRFDRMGVFAYSPEVRTPAAEFPGQIPENVALLRADELNLLQQNIMAEKMDTMRGSIIEAIIDFRNGKSAVGRGSADAPDIDTVVHITCRGKFPAPGIYIPVRVTGRKGLEFTAETVE